MQNLHATCVQVSGTGVLLLGPPGSGKSDLALRLVECAGSMVETAPPGAVLVADDQVLVEASADGLAARAPDALRGRLEVRGIGIVSVPYITETTVRLAVRLGTPSETERIPDFDRQVTDIAGIVLPQLFLNAFEASAPAKVRAMVQAMAAGRFANDVPIQADG